MSQEEGSDLKKALGPLMLWGLGVGYVISGMYFGWNLGLPAGGTLGMLVAVLFIIVMYISFSFSYIELACAIPKAGGAFDYAYRALGARWGFLAGMAQNIEFIFAPPAIAFAIGAYLSAWIPGLTTTTVAVIAYLVFTTINIIGVRTAALFELVITIIALTGLLLFAGLTLPHFEFANLTQNPLPNGWSGAFAAIPFAIWFFLAIEGVANVAEETINPQRNILIGFGAAILTLTVLCLLVFVSASGVSGWEAVVYQEGSSTPSDSPLPLVLSAVVGENVWIIHLFTGIGIFGLIASFHGILLAGGRATFEFARVGFAPKAFGTTHRKYKTPVKALIFNTILGIIILLTGQTGQIIIMACFGALSLYIVSMVSSCVLRVKEPDLPRSFKTPFHPVTPILALVIATVSLVTMTIYYPLLGLIFYSLLLISYAGFKIFLENKLMAGRVS